MVNNELRVFSEKPRLARMSTIDADGYPHTVPVWYTLDGDDIIITIPRSTAKMRHIEANPKGCITIGGEAEDGGGWLFKGEFEIDADDAWPWLEKMTYHYESAEQAAKDLNDWADIDMVLIRMKPNKSIKF